MLYDMWSDTHEISSMFSDGRRPSIAMPNVPDGRRGSYALPPINARRLSMAPPGFGDGRRASIALPKIRGRRQGLRTKPRPSMVPGDPQYDPAGMNPQVGMDGPPKNQQSGFYQFLTTSDFEEGGPRQVSIADVWSGLKEQTTAHGIPHVTHAKGPVKKAFWSIMTALTVGALIFNLSAITQTFFARNVDVTIKLEHKNELTFPAITVCNMSPVRKSAVAGIGKSRRRRAVVSSCPDGWSVYQTSCYWTSNVTATFTSSTSQCTSHGASLADVRDSGELAFVKSISTSLDNSEYWVFLAYETSVGAWQWNSATNASYLPWSTGQPDSTGDCAALTSTDLQDQDCTALHKFVCRKATVVTEPTTEAPGGAGSNSADGTSSDASCCCTCCFTSADDPYSEDTCGTCTGRDASNAGHCAAATTPAPPTTPPPPTTTTTAEPQPIPGSKYPERIQTREEFQQEEKLTEQLAEIVDVEEKKALGYSATSLILDCQYAGYTCDISEFDTFYNPILGNCYVFNAGWTNVSLPLKESLKAGRRHGLHLILNIDQSEYVKEVGDTAGVRLVVHPQSRMPFPEDEGITVSPGHATSIGMKQVMLKREPHPYGTCTDPSTDHTDTNLYEEIFPTNYSSNACQRTCYQRHVISRCGCGDPAYPLVGKALNYGELTIGPCNSSNITQDDCKYVVGVEYNNNELECDCPDSCRDTAYSLEVSIGEWPSNVQKDSLLQKLSPKIGTSFDITHPDEYKENLIKAEIYYEEFNFEFISERPAYKPGNYLSDIGGVLGLWVGFSILTIFEFVEFAMDLFVILIARCRKPKSSGPAPGGAPDTMPTKTNQGPPAPPGNNHPKLDVDQDLKDLQASCRNLYQDIHHKPMNSRM